jgi:hypothetical protein
MLTTLALVFSVAQAAAPVPVTRLPAAAPVFAARSAPVRADDLAPSIDGRIARADSLALAGRIGAAEDLLHHVIDEQASAGRYARDALWHLAMAYDFTDDNAKLARTLDQLAAAAATYGDPQMELEATFEATRLHVELRDGRAELSRVDRIRCLLQSPAIPEAVKADYKSRIVDDTKKG